VADDDPRDDDEQHAAHERAVEYQQYLRDNDQFLDIVHNYNDTAHGNHDDIPLGDDQYVVIHHIIFFVPDDDSGGAGDTDDFDNLNDVNDYLASFPDPYDNGTDGLPAVASDSYDIYGIPHFYFDHQSAKRKCNKRNHRPARFGPYEPRRGFGGTGNDDRSDTD
jgi:hypothetical protein